MTAWEDIRRAALPPFGPFASANMGVIGYMLYREAPRLGIGTSIAFAVLAIAVLVALPIGIYMVTTPTIPAS
jgi:hypothetical protein